MMLILKTTSGKIIELDEDHIETFELQLGNNRIYKNEKDKNYYFLTLKSIKRNGIPGCQGISTKLTNH